MHVVSKLSSFCGVVLSDLSKMAIILLMKRELVALRSSCFACVCYTPLPNNVLDWFAVCDFCISWKYALSGVKVICKTGASKSYLVFPDIISTNFVNNNVPVCAHLKMQITTRKGPINDSRQRSKPQYLSSD